MKKILMSVFMAALGIAAFGEIREELKEDIKGTILFYTSKSNFEQTKDYLIYTVSNTKGENEKIILDRNFYATKAEIKREKKEVDVSVSREKNIITVDGNIDGRKISKKQEINEKPWIETLPVGLGEMVRKEKKEMNFWIMQPGDFTFREVVAIDEGIEKIGDQKCKRVKITLPGAMSLVWSSYFWFEEKTGIFVRYKGNRGPGTPDTIIEAVKRSEG